MDLAYALRFTGFDPESAYDLSDVCIKDDLAYAVLRKVVALAETGMCLSPSQVCVMFVRELVRSRADLHRHLIELSCRLPAALTFIKADK